MTGEVLHIALGDAAGGTLDDARSLGLPGAVFTIPDDLSHGPLHDGRERAAYFRRAAVGYDDFPIPEDVFESWRALSRRIEADRPNTVVVWHSDSVSDMVFLRMTCRELAGDGAKVESVNVTHLSGHCGVGVHDPTELRSAFDHRVPLSKAERQRLTDDFVRILGLGCGVRRLADGQITVLPLDHFDAYVLARVGAGWQRAVRVVGNCLADSDEQDCIGDLFFSWRLQTLIAAGRLEADGDQSHLRGYRVRRI